MTDPTTQSDPSNQSQSNIANIALDSQQAPIAPEISTKDKKADIIKKYENLKGEYEKKARQTKSRKEECAKEKEVAVLQRAERYSVESIAQESIILEGGISKMMSSLRKDLENHARKLTEIREAIKIAEQNLKNVHDIEVAADTLANLIETEELKKEQFEEEIEKKYEEWKREKEEYAYKTKMEREREHDVYEIRKAELERELTERRAVLQTEEAEVQTLRERAKTFDTELIQAIENTKSETETQIHEQEKSRTDLREEQVKRDLSIATLKIESFKKENDSLHANLASITAQLTQANREAKEIAIKVIEGASEKRAFQDVSRIAMEQAKRNSVSNS